MLQRLSLPHAPGPQNPASPHIIRTTVLCPSSLPSPPAAIACIRGHTSKVMFFFFFFSFLSSPVLQRPLFPTRRVLKPPPLHRASPLEPRKSRRRHCLIRGHVSKVMFFSFFFFFFFLPMLHKLSLFPAPG